MKTLPATERGRRTRAVIVESAARLMHEQGLAATCIDDVLLASRTGKSQLYHYFDSKQDLAVAVMIHDFDHVMAVQPALTDLTCADLRRWCDEVVDAHRNGAHGTCPLGTFVGHVEGDTVLRATLNGLFTRWHSAVADLLARAVQASQVHADTDPDAAGWALLTTLQGGTMLSHLRDDHRPLAAALDAVVDGLVIAPR